jgi:GntR family histidine utilization transcriptional repressor
VSTWTSQLTLDGSGPVYDQIKRALLTLIRDGSWPPGHRIPAEADMASHFGAARMTVNRAIKELTESGLVVRKRRAGSFVASPPAPSAMLEIVDMSTAIPARGQDYAYECLIDETVEIDETIADRMRLKAGASVQHIICRHRADGQIIELEERWINLALLPEAATAGFSDQAPGAWLLSAAPWTEAEHSVSAINADARLAELISTSNGDACLVLERRTFQGEKIVTFARLTHPGDRHRMTERFAPGR